MLHHLVQLDDRFTDPHVVHGITHPTNRDIEHAWVVDGNVAYTVTSFSPAALVAFPLEHYYAVVEPRQMTTFTPNEVAQRIADGEYWEYWGTR